ncbi:MAG: FtsW/RodA/SpoVE family cell cycle protein [Oscillospiraceae bacterium]
MPIIENLNNWIEHAGAVISDLLELGAPFLGIYTLLFRWAGPVLVCLILYRSARSLLVYKSETEIWAYLSLPNGARVPVSHWENAIGRSSRCDIVLNYPTVSRNHAVLVRSDDGSWSIVDIGSKGGVSVNSEPVSGRLKVNPGDIISLSGVETVLLQTDDITEDNEDVPKEDDVKRIKPGCTLLLLTVFQILTAAELCITAESGNIVYILLSFLGLTTFMWLEFLIMKTLGRTGFEVETLAFFLSTLGFSVIASAAPSELFKQFIALVLGLCLFIFLGWYLRDLERAKKARWYMGGAAILLLAANLALGKTVNGAQNWISLGPFSFQPSELVKIAFIYAGASTLDRLLEKRNLILFIIFSGVCIGTLALLGDFGTALVFFVAFVVIAFLRSGDISTISLICAGTAFAGVLAVHFKPYIGRRFSAWRHVWEYASTTGYQQTRTLMYAASGGLLGLGAGNGLLKYITAADTDLVFGMLCEEWGLIIAACAVLSFVCLAVFAVRAAPAGRSSFYVIAACAAVSMLMFQAALNMFGSVDFLPLTGVTFPFVSNGGSSMMSSWGLLAFVKAADTRRNASFAIRKTEDAE